MAESFHQQVRKIVIPPNKKDAYVYKFGSKGLKRDTSKQHEGVWNAYPKSLAQYPLRVSPVKVWIFSYDHLKNTDILEGILDNSPNQGEFGYSCQNVKEAKPEEMVFFLPKQKLPDSYKPGGIWVYPDFKLENLKDLDDGTTGFMVMGDKTVKKEKLDVGGQWTMMGQNTKVKQKKNEAKLGGRRNKEPFGVKIRQKSNGDIFQLRFPSSQTKVDKLKDKIYSEKGVPSEDQRLSFNDTALEGNKTLEDYGIKNGDIIDLEPMKVYVKNPSGKRFLFQVAPDELVEELMEKVEIQEGTPMERQILSFYRKKLDPAKALNFYRIKHMNVIEMELGPLVQKSRIFVDIPEGLNFEGDPKNRIELNVAPTATFGHVKKLIEEQTGVPKAKQRIFFQDKEMIDKKSIGKAKLKDRGTIRMEPVPDPEVEVQMPDGTSRQFIFDPEEPVREFKDRNKAEFPLGSKLMFNDREMVDEDPMGKYNLKKGNILLAEPDELQVDTPRGKVMLSAFSTLTPSNIKGVIEEETGVPKSRQRLFYLDEELVDDTKPLDKSKLQALGLQGIRMEPVTEDDPEDPALAKSCNSRAFYLSEPEEMEIMLPNGKKVTLSVSPTMTVEELKAIIEERVPEMKEQKQRLFFFDSNDINNKTPISKVMFDRGSPLEVKPFEITIEQTDELSFQLYPDPLEYLDDIKERIEERTKIPVDSQRITYKGSQLDDTLTLAAQGIKHNSNLKLGKTMEILVETPEGKQIALAVQYDESICSIKEKLEKIARQPVERQCIFSGADLLEEADTLDAKGIEDGDIVRMELFKVNFLHWLGYEFSIDGLTPNSTVLAMKALIEEDKSILKEDQNFELKGKVLTNDKLLHQQGVKHKSLIVMQEGKKIEISLPRKKKMTLTIFPTTTIGEMKRIIEEKIPAMKSKKQRLFTFDTKDEIDNETPLSKLDFDSGHPLALRPMEISVKHWNGKSFDVPCAPSDYIEDVKEMLEDLTGIEAASQQLTHEGEKVDDTLRLDEQGIVHGSVLLLEQMRIFVQVPDGRNIRLRAELTDTIKVIKKKIAKKTGQHHEKQSILLGGEDLDDKATLGACKIENGDKVIMEKFRIDIMDGSDGTVVTLADVARSDSIDVIRQQILKEYDRRVDPDEMYWQENVLALDGSSSLKELGIPHKSILIIRVPDDKDAEYQADTPQIEFFKTKRFSDVNEDILMPVKPDLRTRTFIFDNDATPIDGFISITVLHWSGKAYKFNDLRPRETIKALAKRMKKKKNFPAFHLLLNGKILDESGRLLDFGISHKSFLVMEEIKRKSIDILPQVDKINLGALTSHATDKITVQIKLWNGKKLKLDVGAKEYIDDIRDALFNHLSIPVEYQLLSFDGNLLDDTMTLDEQEITDGCLLVLEHLEIQVNLPFKSTMKMRVEPDDTIAFIKQKIAKQTSFVAKVQCLLFQGEVLGDADCIMDCNIQHKDELELELFVVTILQLKGAKFTVSGSIHPGSTISDVQHVIAKKQLIPTHLQQLRLHEMLLDPSVKLSRQGVVHKSILILEVSSSANAQKEVKIEKVHLEVPSAPPPVQRQMSNPELGLLPLQGQTKVKVKAANMKSQSSDPDEALVDDMDQPLPSTEDLATLETVDTKSVTRGRQEKRKKGKKSKSLDLLEANHRSTNNSSKLLDLTRATKDYEKPVMRTQKGKRSKSLDPVMKNSSKSDSVRDGDDPKPMMRGQKTDSRKKKTKRSKSVDPADARSREHGNETLLKQGQKTDKKKKKKGKRSKSVDPSSKSKSLDLATADDSSKPAKKKRGKRPGKFNKRSKSPKKMTEMDDDGSSAGDKPTLKPGKRRSKSEDGDDASKPSMRGRKPGKGIRSKSVDPADSHFGDHREREEEQTKEDTKQKHSTSVNAYKLGKLAGRVTIDKSTVKQEEEPKKSRKGGGGGWWDM